MTAPDQTAKRLAQLDELRSTTRQGIASGTAYLTALDLEREQLVALKGCSEVAGNGVPKYLSRTDAAKYLLISTGTLDLWRYENRGPNFVRAGRRRILYSSTALDAWAAANAAGPFTAGSSER